MFGLQVFAPFRLELEAFFLELFAVAQVVDGLGVGDARKVIVYDEAERFQQRHRAALVFGQIFFFLLDALIQESEIIGVVV